MRSALVKQMLRASLKADLGVHDDAHHHRGTAARRAVVSRERVVIRDLGRADQPAVLIERKPIVH